MGKTSVVQAKSLKVGDRIDTTTGVRKVLNVVPYRPFGTKVTLVTVTVECPASPPQWAADIRFQPTDKVARVKES